MAESNHFWGSATATPEKVIERNHGKWLVWIFAMIKQKPISLGSCTNRLVNDFDFGKGIYLGDINNSSSPHENDLEEFIDEE